MSHLERLDSWRVLEGWVCQSSGGSFIPSSGTWTEMPAKPRSLTSVSLLEVSMYLGLILGLASPLEGTQKTSTPGETDILPVLSQSASKYYHQFSHYFLLVGRSIQITKEGPRASLFDIKSLSMKFSIFFSFQPVRTNFLVIGATGFSLVWESEWLKFFMMHRALCG